FLDEGVFTRPPKVDASPMSYRDAFEAFIEQPVSVSKRRVGNSNSNDFADEFPGFRQAFSDALGKPSDPSIGISFSPESTLECLLECSRVSNWLLFGLQSPGANFVIL